MGSEVFQFGQNKMQGGNDEKGDQIRFDAYKLDCKLFLEVKLSEEGKGAVMYERHHDKRQHEITEQFKVQVIHFGTEV